MSSKVDSQFATQRTSPPLVFPEVWITNNYIPNIIETSNISNSKLQHQIKHTYTLMNLLFKYH